MQLFLTTLKYVLQRDLSLWILSDALQRYGRSTMTFAAELKPYPILCLLVSHLVAIVSRQHTNQPFLVVASLKFD